MSTEKVEKIIQDIKGLPFEQVFELVKGIEAEFGVSAAPIAVAGPAAGPAAAVKTEFDVILEDAGEKKIDTIRALRSLDSNLGLKEAKELAESAPCTIKKGASKDEAESIKKLFEAAGAKVKLS